MKPRTKVSDPVLDQILQEGIEEESPTSRGRVEGTVLESYVVEAKRGGARWIKVFVDISWRSPAVIWINPDLVRDSLEPGDRIIAEGFIGQRQGNTAFYIRRVEVTRSIQNGYKQ